MSTRGRSWRPSSPAAGGRPPAPASAAFPLLLGQGSPRERHRDSVPLQPPGRPASPHSPGSCLCGAALRSGLGPRWLWSGAFLHTVADADPCPGVRAQAPASVPGEEPPAGPSASSFPLLARALGASQPRQPGAPYGGRRRGGAFSTTWTLSRGSSGGAGLRCARAGCRFVLDSFEVGIPAPFVCFGSP